MTKKEISTSIIGNFPFIGKSVLSNNKNSPAIGFGSSTRFRKTKKPSPGPSDYDTDNESIGNRCMTALRDVSNPELLDEFRFRNATPEFNEQRRH